MRDHGNEVEKQRTTTRSEADQVWLPTLKIKKMFEVNRAGGEGVFHFK